MSRFRFEKDRVAATLCLATGQTIHGFFFVATSLSTHAGRERVRDLLNATDGFFPFQRIDGITTQYNRRHLVLVRLPDSVDEESREPGYELAIRRAVVLTLSTGTRINGTVAVYGPAGHERLSDYMNSAEHFRYVGTMDGTVIVNADHIVEVTERAES